MIESLKKILLTATILATTSLFAQTTIPWTGQPGEVETAIANAGGEGEFVLEAGQIYFMTAQVLVEAGKVLKVSGATADGVQKASLQPHPSEDLTVFGGEMFVANGDGAEIHLDNLLLNGMAINQGGQVGIGKAGAADNHIHVNNCIISGVAALAFHTMGTGTDFTLTDNIFTNFTSYPGGAFYGGVVWGGGSWMGTMDMLVVERNTFHGVVGEAIVAYEYVEPGSKVDHNTFANISMGAFYYYTANNLQITNNVFYNTRTWGQTRYDASLNPVVDGEGNPVYSMEAADADMDGVPDSTDSDGDGVFDTATMTQVLDEDGNPVQATNGWGVVWPGGVGQLESRAKTLGTSGVDADGNPTGLYNMGADGQEVDMNNRNVYWGNNAVVWSQGLIDWINGHAGEDANGDGYGDTPCYSWTTTVANEDGTESEVTIEDHMLLLEHQAVLQSDTTLNNIARMVGVTESNNALLSDTEFRSLIHPLYLAHQLLRHDDFKDDQTTNGVGKDHRWVWQPVSSDDPAALHSLLEYPLHLDCRYAASSAAATHSTTGGPVGDPRWEPHNETVGVDQESVPGSFSLKQNYPNPFNPTTEIAFTLDNASNISLTIFNALGQEVKTLVNSSRNAGTHTVKWDGRDASGMAVSTGLYFYTLSDGNKSFTKKMALMK